MKKLLFRISLVVLVLIMAIGMTACGGLFGDDEDDSKGANLDHYGFERPKDCWITDVLLLNDEMSLDRMFGTSGDSGILSEAALAADGTGLSANQRGENFMSTSRNVLACLIYGDIGSYGMNLETYLKFTLINGTQVLYDEECVKLDTPRIYAAKGDYDINIDMSKTPDGRLTITKNEDEPVMQACVFIPFELLQEGTLYADLRIDCVNVSGDSNSFVDDYAMAEIGVEAASTQVTVNSFSAKYLSEERYNNGAYSDSDLTSEPSFKDGAISYMVMDFEFSANSENDGTKSVNIMVRVPEAEVMDATIEEAPTGKIEEAVVNNVTTIYASYGVPPVAGEVKKVRMVVRLKPLDEGVANVDVFLVGGADTKTTGSNYITTKLVSGTPTLRYTLSRDKTYYTATSLWQASVTEITVPDTYLGLPVKGMSAGILKGNTKVRTLVIGNNVTSLGASDFAGCTALSGVTLGSGITSLPNALFEDCDALRTVTLPEGTTEIPARFFSGCTSLVTVNNISTVTEIGSYAFEGCSSLKTLSCGEITSLGSSAFKGCTSLTAVNTLRVSTVSESAFENCTALADIDLTGVTRIAQYAFQNCTALTRIAIPDSEAYVRISEYSFLETSGVKSLYLCKNVDVEHPSDWGSVFDLTSLESITVSPDHERYTAEGNCLVYRYTSATDGSTQLATVYLGCKNSQIPADITYIGDGAFKGCKGLTSITLPNTLLSIDRYAFQNCTGLTQITIPAGVTIIWDHAFEGCTSLTKVKFPSGTWYAANSNHQQAKKERIAVSDTAAAAKALTETYCASYITSSSYYQ